MVSVDIFSKTSKLAQSRSEGKRGKPTEDAAAAAAVVASCHVTGLAWHGSLRHRLRLRVATHGRRDGDCSGLQIYL